MTSGSWDHHLDAVEEWVRQTEAALTGGAETLPVTPTAPPGQLPGPLALRAHGALQQLDDLLGSTTRRRGELDRKRAYAGT